MTLELNVHFSGAKASDLPWLYDEEKTTEGTYFIGDGIKLKYKEGIRQASLAAPQSDMVSFIIIIFDISGWKKSFYLMIFSLVYSHK